MIASATPRPERYVLSPVSPHAKVEMSKNDPSSFYKSSEVRLPPMRVLDHSQDVQLPQLPQLQLGNQSQGVQPVSQGVQPVSQVTQPSNQPYDTNQAPPAPHSASGSPPHPHSISSTPVSTTPVPHLHSQAPTPVQLSQPLSQPLSHPQPQMPQPPPLLQPQSQPQQMTNQLSQPLSQPLTNPLSHQPQHTPQPMGQPMASHAPPLHHPTPQPPQPQPYGHIPPPMPMTHPMMPPYYTPFSGQDFKRKTFEAKETASHMYQMISQLETFVQSHGGDMRTMAHAASSPHCPLPSMDALNAMILRLRSCSAIFDEWRDNVVSIHQAAASSQPQNSQYPPKTTPPASPLFINTNTKRKRKRSRSDASTTVCRGCGTTETPEWRKGPEGARTLCNACGLYHAKLAKRKGINVAGEAIRQKRMRTNLSE